MVLSEAGFNVPESARCLAPGQIIDALGRDPYPSQRGLEPALAMADQAGYPLVVKPNRGSRARAVQLATDEATLKSAVKQAWAIDRLALVQKPVPGFDLRIDVLDGELLLAYVRRPLVLIGDGRATLLELHETADSRVKDKNFAAKLRSSPAWQNTLKAEGLEPTSILEQGRTLEFKTTIYNLHQCCIGELIKDLPTAWVKLASQISEVVGLRHAGIDLRLPLNCNGLNHTVGQATVLEVNASPAIGQIRNLDGRLEAEQTERRLLTVALGEA